MRALITQLKSFIALYPLWYWITLLVFCALSVYLNYAWGLNAYINRLPDIQSYFAYMALYAVHTLFAYLLYSLQFREYRIWVDPGFMLMLFLGFAVFAGRAVLWQHGLLIENMSEPGRMGLNKLIYSDLFRILYILIPIALIWFFADRKRMPLYGLNAEKHKSGMYLMLLLCMVPLICGAGMLGDFLSYYPRFRKLCSYGADGYDILRYELFYGMDFISIELFFRGFMVIAFIRFAGIHAVLPMAVFYMSIHYGKPMGEAISSFFGGSILGVIAFYSRSIYGGILVHVGIAWLMELCAWLGNLMKGSWPY